MCPNPFNMMLDTLAIVFGVMFFSISWIAGLIWVIVCFLCWIFADRNYVMCGIPVGYPSRYEKWREERNKTPEQRIEEQNKRRESVDRVSMIFEDLKERGCIDKDRKLVFK